MPMFLDKLKSQLNQFRQPTDNTRYITALDIGTEYVKALIGKVQGEGEERRVEVIGVGRAHQKLSDMHSGAIADIAGVVDNCDRALREAEEGANVTAKDVAIGIAGELVKGETTTLKYRRPDPSRPIEKAELDKIVEKVQERALARAKAQLAWEAGTSEIEIKLVNAAVVNMFIDGYKVNNPMGFQGKDVSVQLFTAFAPMVHIGAIERVASDLDLNLINVSAEPYAMAKSVGVGHSETFSAIFMDVGGGTTDIALVNDGGVEGTKMFGIGGRSFTGALVSQLNLPFDQAEKIKLALSSDKLSTERRGRVLEILSPTLQVWLNGVELALSEFEKVDQLPSKILLCGGGASLPPLVEALKGSDWRADLPFAKAVSIAHISPSEVSSVVDKSGKITDHTFITPMALLNVGLDAIMGAGRSSMMSKLNKALQT